MTKMASTVATVEETVAEQERTALLALVRAGLWEREPAECEGCFPLPAASWGTVFRLARQQTVTGLAFCGLRHLPSHLLPHESLVMRWAAETDTVERRNRKMNQALAQLSAEFRQRGLNPVLQKGQGTARYYEQPLVRECGDIDLYFGSGREWQSAMDYLHQCGIRVKRQADEGIYYQWHGTSVEHHRHLLDLYNPSMREFMKQIEEKHGYRQFALPTEPAASIAVPSPFLELLLLNLHILKHGIGRGIGLRQLCDMARACYRLHGEVDPQEMKSACRRLGLGRWCQLLHSFLVECLGLPVGCLPYPETALTARPLADVVWRGGNFGQHDAGLQQQATGWRRKFQTARSFGRNVGFAFHYAPKEAFWFFLQLTKGQVK